MKKKSIIWTIEGDRELIQLREAMWAAKRRCWRKTTELLKYNPDLKAKAPEYIFEYICMLTAPSGGITDEHRQLVHKYWNHAATPMDETVESWVSNPDFKTNPSIEMAFDFMDCSPGGKGLIRAIIEIVLIKTDSELAELEKKYDLRRRELGFGSPEWEEECKKQSERMDKEEQKPNSNDPPPRF